MAKGSVPAALKAHQFAPGGGRVGTKSTAKKATAKKSTAKKGK